jgi:hypothetical protein
MLSIIFYSLENEKATILSSKSIENYPNLSIRYETE